ncbi:MAG: multiheme c-type cytochrome [Myxococcaceae bacterium]
MSRAGLLLLCAVLGSCTRSKETRSKASPPKPIAIFVSSDVRGYLGPCGCSENMRGGIARAAHILAEAQKSHDVLFFDAGDTLFGAVSLPKVKVPQEKRKAQALAAAYQQMGLTARGVGERDNALGDAFRGSLGLKEIAPGQAWADHRIAAVFAEDEAALVKAAKAAHAQGALLVVGLLHAGLPVAKSAAENPALDADLLVVSHATDENFGEESALLKTRVPVAVVQSKGRSLLRLDTTWDGGEARFEWIASAEDVQRELAASDERIERLREEVNAPGLKPELLQLKRAKLEELMARREQRASQPPPKIAGRNSLSARFVPLESNVPAEPAVEKLVKAHDQDVARLNLAWAKAHGQDCPPAAKGEAAFVGNAPCKECHDETFAIWTSSKHAHAYKTLEEKGRQYDLECVRCHVVGMDQPGGVCRVDKVEARAHVGCESCHGPGSIHSDDPTDKNIGAGNTPSTCVGCHDRENSPHFEFQSYLSQILGPGHGATKR